jgi:hypothetical protein
MLLDVSLDPTVERANAFHRFFSIIAMDNWQPAQAPLTETRLTCLTLTTAYHLQKVEVRSTTRKLYISVQRLIFCKTAPIPSTLSWKAMIHEKKQPFPHVDRIVNERTF